MTLKRTFAWLAVIVGLLGTMYALSQLTFLHQMHRNWVSGWDWMWGLRVDLTGPLVVTYFVLFTSIAIMVFGILVAASNKSNKALSITLLVLVAVGFVVSLSTVTVKMLDRVMTGNYFNLGVSYWSGLELLALMSVKIVIIVLIGIYLAKVCKGKVAFEYGQLVPGQEVKTRNENRNEGCELNEKVVFAKKLKEDGILNEEEYKNILMEILQK